jgi:hypothetical protein
MDRIQLLTLVIVSIIAGQSCFERKFVQGHAELITITDTLLRDSALVFGNVYRVDGVTNYPYHKDEFEIWLENSVYRTTTDTSGCYSLKVPQGTYQIKCKSTLSEWEQLTESINDLEIAGNKKIHIDFYIGYTVE